MGGRLASLVLGGFIAMSSVVAQAQSFPNRYVTMIVPFPAGSGPDVYARIVGAKAAPLLGQSIVIENRVGAGGTVGGRVLARAEPDGYTIMFGSTSSVLVAPAVAKDPPYDPVQAFSPIIQVVRGPFILSVRSDLPIKTLKDLIGYAKSNPGKLNYGTSGVGSLHHLATEMLKRAANIDMVHVPFTGGSQSWSAIQSGDIDVIFDSMPGPASTLQAGKARSIAVTGSRRMPPLEDVPMLAATPTFLEQGITNVDVTFWFGIVAPAQTPKAIIETLNKAINAVLIDPAINSRFTAEGMEVTGGSSDDFARVISDGAVQWRDLVNSLGIKQQ